MKGTEDQIIFANRIKNTLLSSCDGHVAIWTERFQQTMPEYVESFKTIKKYYEDLFSDNALQDAAVIIGYRTLLLKPGEIVEEAEAMSFRTGISVLEATKIMCSVA